MMPAHSFDTSAYQQFALARTSPTNARAGAVLGGNGADV
eukprot:COSAG01_NODE_21144_length_916_cov_0.724602_3_plen_38_part_01